ncbi:MAG: hypothetical protein R8K46_00150 [Mariprofundaceae bacterium]
MISAGKQAEVQVRIKGAAAGAHIVLEAAAKSAKSESLPLDVRQGVNYGGQRKGFTQGNILYVADWFSGLHIYDIANPAQPRLLSTFHTPGSAKGVVVRGRYAFIADDDHGLQIIDVGIPTEPEWVANLATSGLAYTPVIDGDRLYLASHRGGVHIIDIKNPAEPRLIGGFDTPNKAWSVAVEGDIAYVADAASGLLVFDVRDAARPKQIGHFSPGGNAEDVVVENGIAYVAFFDKGLYILDVRHPAEPRLWAHVPTPGEARGVFIDDGRVYVADWFSGLHILHVRDPDRPIRLGGFDTMGAAWGVQVKGKYAYVFDWWGGMTTLDIRDARRPVLVDRYPERGSVRRVALAGGFLYAINGAGLQVFDVNNPLNPIWSTGLEMAGGATGLAVREGLALLATGNKLTFIDNGNPFQLRWQAELTLPSTVIAMALADGRAFIAGDDGYIRVLDISNPELPRIVHAIRAQARDLWCQNGRLYVADARQGLAVYDVSADVPALMGEGFMNSRARLVRGRGDIVFTYESDGIITAIDLSGMNPPTTKRFELPGDIIDMQWRGDALFALTRSALFRLDAADPFAMRISARYALAQPAKGMAFSRDTAYLAGGKRVVAVQLMPEISQTLEGSVIRLTLPAGMPAGSYDMLLMSGKGKADIRRRALRVKNIPFSKPKLSKKAFEKLLKQQLRPSK